MELRSTNTISNERFKDVCKFMQLGEVSKKPEIKEVIEEVKTKKVEEKIEPSIPEFLIKIQNERAAERFAMQELINEQSKRSIARDFNKKHKKNLFKKFFI